MCFRFLNDGGFVIVQWPSLNSSEFVTAQTCVLVSRRRPLSFVQCVSAQLCRQCEVFQCNRFFFRGVVTPSLMSVGPGFWLMLGIFSECVMSLSRCMCACSAWPRCPSCSRSSSWGHLFECTLHKHLFTTEHTCFRFTEAPLDITCAMWCLVRSQHLDVWCTSACCGRSMWAEGLGTSRGACQEVACSALPPRHHFRLRVALGRVVSATTLFSSPPQRALWRSNAKFACLIEKTIQKKRTVPMHSNQKEKRQRTDEKCPRTYIKKKKTTTPQNVPTDSHQKEQRFERTKLWVPSTSICSFCVLLPCHSTSAGLVVLLFFFATWDILIVYVFVVIIINTCSMVSKCLSCLSVISQCIVEDSRVNVCVSDWSLLPRRFVDFILFFLPFCGLLGGDVMNARYFEAIILGSEFHFFFLKK